MITTDRFERALAPATLPTMTESHLLRAVQRAVRVLEGPGTTIAPLPEIAQALLYLYARLQSDEVLVVGDTLRLSVSLLRDLYDMPGHESVRVRFTAAPREADGTHLLLVHPVRTSEEAVRA